MSEVTPKFPPVSPGVFLYILYLYFYICIFLYFYTRIRVSLPARGPARVHRGGRKSPPPLKKNFSTNEKEFQYQWKWISNSMKMTFNINEKGFQYQWNWISIPMKLNFTCKYCNSTAIWLHNDCYLTDIVLI